MPFYVESRGRVALLHLNEGENRFNFENINSILRCLDEVEANPEFIALVTIGHGKYFSLGLDLDWIGKFQLLISGHCYYKTCSPQKDLQMLAGAVIITKSLLLPTGR